MKKILLSLILCVTLVGSFAFAEEAPSLVSQITELETTIVELEKALLDESITQENHDALTLQLEESKLALAVLLEQQEQILRAQEEEALLNEVSRLDAIHQALQNIDTSTMTAEELEAHQLALKVAYDNIQVAKKAYQEFLGPTQEELKTALQADLDKFKAEILALEASLKNESLTEEERLAIQANLKELNTQLESTERQLADIIAQEQAQAIANLTEELTRLEADLKEKLAALEAGTLTPEEKKALEEAIATLEGKIESIQEELEAIDESIDEDNPNFERFLMAKELNITPGKMNLLEKLSEAAQVEDFDFANWSEKSVKEIMAEIKAHKNADNKKTEAEGASQKEEKSPKNNIKPKKK